MHDLIRADRYRIPARQARIEMRVVNSRFIATAAPVFTVEEAKAFVSRMRAEFADASHNVSAYLVGHGATVVAHCGDDGEPSGTAGRPVLAVLRGSGLGDVAVVVTRYFGGTKLGTGGLVRSYGGAVREVLAVLPRAERVPTHTALAAVPYDLFERTRLAVTSSGGSVLSEEFAGDVTITLRFPVERFAGFQEALQELSAGSVEAVVIETTEEVVPVGDCGPRAPGD